MLIYHPAYDAYHCIFRLLLISEHINKVETDKIRLLDFYLVFPGSVANIKLPSELIGLRRESKKLANIYRDPLSEVATFHEMKGIQDAALRSVVASGFFDLDSYSKGYVSRSLKPLPVGIEQRIENILESTGSVGLSAIIGLSQVPLLGKNGLKDRTHLMEYRYDPA
ncbi:ABC-three component system middle component 5 [Delftia sp. HK171]|uniref:ABC-three component system middle component 5 n=1 Tax=Delftia sp. HK171 TaxID=1920191 RepID=UPI0009031584|nr:ABC-three component system middle component 5 [Delftia sp. HK171]